jgi:hypothetical protein
MKLTYPLLLNAKPKAKPYKLTDRDSMYLYVSITGTKTWKFDYRLDEGLHVHSRALPRPIAS